MTRKAPAVLAAILVTLMSSGLAVALSSSTAVPQAVDLTPQFRSAGLAIDGLRAFAIGGVVVIRGRVYDRSVAEDAGRLAQSLGYSRVANLVQVKSPPDDAAIERYAERELTIHRSLDGCTFHVDSDRGILNVNGTVQNDVQKDVAIQLLRNIDGVREVHAELVTK